MSDRMLWKKVLVELQPYRWNSKLKYGCLLNVECLFMWADTNCSLAGRMLSVCGGGVCSLTYVHMCPAHFFFFNFHLCCSMRNILSSVNFNASFLWNCLKRQCVYVCVCVCVCTSVSTRPGSARCLTCLCGSHTSLCSYNEVWGWQWFENSLHAYRILIKTTNL